MRLSFARLLALASLTLTVGCAPAPSNGGLWAQQELQQELAMFRLSDAQRADGARAYELTVADTQLAAEQARLNGLLAGCPGPPQPLGLSEGDRVRDGIRIQAQGDASHLAAVAQLALADWQLRRGAATGDSQFCDRARQTLAGHSQLTAASVPDPFASPPTATVQRDVSRPGVLLDSASPDTVLSEYALGVVDSVRAPSPLPEYLAAVYGGTATADAPPAIPSDVSVEALVDQFAPAHPEWEPDALYVALRAT
jgi:hypothetical protein